MAPPDPASSGDFAFRWLSTALGGSSSGFCLASCFAEAFALPSPSRARPVCALPEHSVVRMRPGGGNVLEVCVPTPARPWPASPGLGEGGQPGSCPPLGWAPWSHHGRQVLLLDLLLLPSLASTTKASRGLVEGCWLRFRFCGGRGWQWCPVLHADSFLPAAMV